jgi:hypothetical protein
MGQNKKIENFLACFRRISRDEKSYLVGIDGSLAVRMYQRKCTAETQ